MRLLTCLIAVLLATPVIADVRIDRLSTAGSLKVEELLEVSPGVWRVEVTVVSHPGYSFRVLADEEDEIEYIKVRASVDPIFATGEVQMTVLGEGSGNVVRLGAVEMLDPPAGCTKADLTISAFVMKDSSGNRGNIGAAGASPGGRLEANRATFLNCEGHFTAEVDIIEGLDVVPSINFVTSSGGDVLNDIAVENGSINHVLANQGQIGSSSSSISITAGGSVGRIRSRDGIWASISASGNMGLVETFAAGADFNGSLSATSLTEVVSGHSGINIRQDLNADISLSGDILQPITVSRSLIGDLSCASGGLEEQVIINSGDLGGSWSGAVTVGVTTLSPKGAYTQTGLGGGAVGLAPFDLHKQDCDPPYSGSTPPTVSSSTIDIDLVHYGPIKHDGTGKPFKVEKYEGHCTPPCIEPDADVTDDWSLTDISGRIMTISGPLEAGHHWHVYPMTTGTDMLKCDGLAAGAGDVPVASYAYIIYREP